MTQEKANKREWTCWKATGSFPLPRRLSCLQWHLCFIKCQALQQLTAKCDRWEHKGSQTHTLTLTHTLQFYWHGHRSHSLTCCSFSAPLFSHLWPQCFSSSSLSPLSLHFFPLSPYSASVMRFLLSVILYHAIWEGKKRKTIIIPVQKNKN